MFGLSGLFVLGYVLIGGPLGTAAEAAARTFFDRGRSGGRSSPEDFRHVALAETVSTNNECFCGRAR